jgi:hypothetical protein
MQESLEHMTILDIRSLEGYLEEPEIIEGAPLSKWYKGIVKKRLRDLTDGDIATLIRQQKHLAYVVPYALTRLQEDPIIGDLYTSEVLTSLLAIEQDFWKANISLKAKVMEFIDGLDKSHFSDINEWLFTEDKDDFEKVIKKLKIALRTEK